MAPPPPCCVFVCECTFASVCIPGGRECRGAHSGSKYCVYQHNESSGREREREERETEREREGGWMEKAIFPLLFSTLPATNPCGVYSLYSPYSLFSTLFSIFFPYFFFFPFSWIDQIASPSFSTALKAIFQALGVWLDRAHRSLFHSPSVSTLDIRHQPGQ